MPSQAHRLFRPGARWLCGCCLALSVSAEAGLKDSIREQLLSDWQRLQTTQPNSLKIEIKGLPSTYSAPDCHSTLVLTPSKPLTLGHNGIEVSCAQGNHWSLMISADIQQWQDVVVNRRHLPRGQALMARDLMLQPRNLANLRQGYFTDQQSLIGMDSKRSLKAGSVINPHMVQAPFVIQRHQKVVLSINKPGIAVQMNGIALTKGRLGERIRVRNSSSQKVLQGVVVSSERVLVQ